MGEVKLQSGDVLVDGSMIVNAVNAIQIGLIDDEGVDFVRFNSLAQLIQVLVTHNRLITISAPMHGFEGKGHAITGWIRNSEYCNCSLDTTWQRVILDNTRSIALNTKKANLVHRQVKD